MVARWNTVRRGGKTIVEEIHKVVVYRFTIDDVDVADLYAPHSPLLQWEQSEPGQFVMKHTAADLIWERQREIYNYSTIYNIVAELEMSKLSEFYLKWGQNGSNKV